MHSADESTAGDRAKGRRPESRSGHGDGAILTHNTLSADITHVQVCYPFHPLLRLQPASLAKTETRGWSSSGPRLGRKAVEDSGMDAAIECKQHHCQRASAIKQGVIAKRHFAVGAMECLGQQR